jgi:predicted nucleic acid-binding protein
MSGTRRVVLDSTVVLAFCDPDNEAHDAVVGAVTGCLRAGDRLVVPTSALCEVLAFAFRTSSHAVVTVDALVDDLVSDLRSVDREVGRAAAQVCAEYPGLPLSAALVVGTARVVGAAEVLTLDESWQTVDRRVQVVC